MDFFNSLFLESQLFWTAFAFAVILSVIWKFLLPSLNNTLDARANQIREDLDRAASLKTEAEQMLRTYEKQLKTAQQEATDIVAKARTDADDLAAKRMTELESEISRKAKSATDSIEQAKLKAMDDLRKEVVTMTLDATEKVVGSLMDSKAATKFADEAVKELN